MHFSGFHMKKKNMTRGNVSPNRTFFKLKMVKSGVHWPRKFLFWGFESYSCTVHFPASRSTFVALPMQLWYCLNYVNPSVSECFVLPASFVLQSKMWASCLAAFLFPSYQALVVRASVSLRCRLLPFWFSVHYAAKSQTFNSMPFTSAWPSFQAIQHGRLARAPKKSSTMRMAPSWRKEQEYRAKAQLVAHLLERWLPTAFETCHIWKVRFQNSQRTNYPHMRGVIISSGVEVPTLYHGTLGSFCGDWHTLFDTLPSVIGGTSWFEVSTPTSTQFYLLKRSFCERHEGKAR